MRMLMSAVLLCIAVMLVGFGVGTVLSPNGGKGGEATEIQTFKIQKSKPIIDKIDRVLAQHYGFTDEELDFIINYDIKYRLGLGS